MLEGAPRVRGGGRGWWLIRGVGALTSTERLLRVRPCAGDPEKPGQVLALRRPTVWGEADRVPCSGAGAPFEE